VQQQNPPRLRGGVGAEQSEENCCCGAEPVDPIHLDAHPSRDKDDQPQQISQAWADRSIADERLPGLFIWIANSGFVGADQTHGRSVPATCR
jgi:hypothetical protein